MYNLYAFVGICGLLVKKRGKNNDKFTYKHPIAFSLLLNYFRFFAVILLLVKKSSSAFVYSSSGVRHFDTREAFSLPVTFTCSFTLELYPTDLSVSTHL
jgi:hypothetical protein